MCKYMKKYKLWIILLCVVFFLTALTIYLNRVVFPVALKQTAITQAETFLKRKVEIGSLRFNWVKGFIIDNIKVYQKDSTQIFVQAEQLSFGVVFIPGFKQHQINIPFMNITNPSAHLVRTGDQWNFSDLLVAPPAQDKPSPFAVALAGVHITGGKLRLDDIRPDVTQTELLDGLDLKVSLSYKGIGFDVSAHLPEKKGRVETSGVYQLSSGALEAKVHINNLRPSDYMSFVPPVEGLKFTNGLLEDVQAEIDYSKERITASGDIAIKDLDLGFNGQSFKGSLTAKLHDLRIEKDALVIDGDVTSPNAAITLAPKQTVKGAISLEKFKVRRDKDGTQLVGTLTVKGLDARMDAQTFKGNVTARPVTIQINPANDITFAGALKMDAFTAEVPGVSFNGDISLDDVSALISVAKGITASAKVAIKDMQLDQPSGAHIKGSIELPSLSLKLANDTVTVKTRGDLNNWQVSMAKDQNVTAQTSFTADVVYPLKTPEDLSYRGTFTVDHAEANGFPGGPFKDIALNGDYATDNLNIKLLSLTAFGTALKASGTIMNFKAPVLNVQAAAEKIDLGKLKEILPDLFKEYGLETSGEASFNAQFQGLASDPLSGKIKAQAKLNNVSVSSLKFNQSAHNISGSIEGTPDALAWNDFTGTYLEKSYTLTGTLNDFKNPRVKTSLDGADVKLHIDAAKDGDIVTIKRLDGKYMNIAFNTTGTVSMPAGKQPAIDLHNKVDLEIKDLLPFLPPEQKKTIEPLNITGALNVEADVKGQLPNWQDWTTNATITSPLLSAMGYKINDVTLVLAQHDGKISNLTVDAVAYEGKVHAVGSGDLSTAKMPFDLALNVEALNMQKLKMDIPAVRGEQINGKFYLTTVSKGELADIMNVQAKGSLAVREGFLGEFKVFKGLLGILNEGLRIGQVMITDVEGNFIVENQKMTTDNLRLKSPTIVLLTEGWVAFNQDCDLKVTVDMSSGVVPQLAEEVLRTLEVHIHDKISNPKFDKKISVPQVINSALKIFGLMQ